MVVHQNLMSLISSRRKPSLHENVALARLVYAQVRVEVEHIEICRRRPLLGPEEEEEARYKWTGHGDDQLDAEREAKNPVDG